MGGESHQAVIGAKARVRQVQPVLLFQKEFSRTDRVRRANADVWLGGWAAILLDSEFASTAALRAVPSSTKRRSAPRTSPRGAAVMGLDALGAFRRARAQPPQKRGLSFCKSVTTVVFANRGSTAR
jgi:hypothetical protein